MSLKAPRNIEVKSLFNPDEYIEFAAECQAADVSKSKKLRDLAKEWLAERNGKRRGDGAEYPGAGHHPAMFLPGRANYGARAHLNMRL